MYFHNSCKHIDTQNLVIYVLENGKMNTSHTCSLLLACHLISTLLCFDA